MTLFNSIDRLAPDGSPVDFPSFSGYGRVVTNSMRLEKRNAAERGIDMLRSFLSSKRKLEDGSLAYASVSFCTSTILMTVFTGPL